MIEADAIKAVTKEMHLTVFTPMGWGKPFQELFDQTDLSGYEMYSLEISEFNFSHAMEILYKQRNAFCLIVKDILYNSENEDEKGRLIFTYLSHAGTEWEREYVVRAPNSGWCVPNDDCSVKNSILNPFFPGTLVPFETVELYQKALPQFIEKKLNTVFMPYFDRADWSKEYERSVARYYQSYDMYENGRFCVNTGINLNNTGNSRFASLPFFRLDVDTVTKIRCKS